MLLGRACQKDGDPRAREAAFEELVRLVMIFIRAGMGRRLRDHRESADVCQSIARSFISDFEEGKLRFESESQLSAYLQRIVRSKLADLARHDAADKRGGGAREASIPDEVVPAAGPGASADMRRDEAFQQVISGLSADEQVIVRLRRQGMTWEQIAGIVGRDGAAVRQQFSRAQRRIDAELGRDA